MSVDLKKIKTEQRNENTKDIDLQSAIILLDFFIKGWKEKGINSIKKNIYILRASLVAQQ